MMAARMGPAYVKGKARRGDTDEMFLYEVDPRGVQTAGASFPARSSCMEHGGLGDLYGGANRWDPNLKRPFSDYLDEAVEQGWQRRPSAR